MAISNYSELQTAIASWLNRTDLTTEIVDFITLGEARIYRDLRIRSMETALSDTIASGVIAVPSDYISLKSAYISGSPARKLEYQTVDFIYRKYPIRSSEAKPFYIAREGTNFIFGPYPDSAYTVNGIYYKRLPALSGANTTNWFTDNAPDILLWASLVESVAYTMDDERLAVWETKYNQARAMIQKEDNKAQRSSGPMRSISA